MHILGALSSMGLNGLNFAFGGAILLPRREVSADYPDGTVRTQFRLICTGDEIRFSAYFAKDASSQVVFSLKGNCIQIHQIRLQLIMPLVCSPWLLEA